MPRRVDREGQRFGKWLVVSRYAGSLWLCRCDCGIEKPVGVSGLLSGRSSGCTSCHSRKHGLEGTSIYNIWAGIKQRCLNPKYHGYGRYGGRGIAVCDKWMSFDGFYEDMGPRPEGLSIGRVDNDGPYCKENCRWETAREQVRNRSNTRTYEYNGGIFALGDLSDISGIPIKSLRFRIHNKGMSVDDAMVDPYVPYKKK